MGKQNPAAKLVTTTYSSLVTNNYSSLMGKLGRVGRLFCGVALAGLGIQQLAYGRFLPALLPTWPTPIPGLAVWAGLVGAGLLAAGAAIIFTWKARLLSLGAGSLLLGLLFGSHVPYELQVDPYSNHLGSWTNALTTLALAGGALTLAGSPWLASGRQPESSVRSTAAGRVSTLGRLCFCTTIVAYGIAHFLYTKYISPLVPAWIPDATFWTYFAGVALIGAGSALLLGIYRQLVALLLGTMLLLWVISVHAPRVLATAFPAKRAELSSLLEALAYTGTALTIASGHSGRKRPASENQVQPVASQEAKHQASS